MRVAIVTGGVDSLEQLQRYLPSNYTATAHYVRPTAIEQPGLPKRRLDNGMVYVITGNDNAGWTLDGYVLPRLASGLIFAEEVTMEGAAV